MKRYLNTLYITTQGVYLHKKGETVEILLKGERLGRIPLITLDSIVCYGNITVSPFLFYACSQHKISVSFLTEKGRFLSRVEGPVAGNVLLRKQQYRISDDKKASANIARSILIGKIYNQRSVLTRLIRDHGNKINREKVEQVVDLMKINLKRLKRMNNLDVIRGIEGESASLYFSTFQELLLERKEEFTFSGRSRRPPRDRVNAMLSFGYTLLYHDIMSALETVGLDPAVGFLHRDRPGRLSLALDCMEEFRPFIDRLVITLITRKEIRVNQFEETATGAVFLKDESKRIFLQAYQERKGTILTHPYLEKKMYLAILYQVQAQLMARFLRGDIDAYPVFIWA